MTNAFWKDKSLAEMSTDEWESLCDGCALCCMHKVEDEDTGELFYTNLACRLLDTGSLRCTDYPNRVREVVDCIDLAADPGAAFDWLPLSCAYRRLANGLDLPEWHPLITGDPESVHRAGISMRSSMVSERDTDEWTVLQKLTEDDGVETDVNDYVTRPLTEYVEYPPDEMLERVKRFYENIDRRRTVRMFSDRPVDREIIATAIRAASTAPSGANMQPWHFVAVSGPETRRRIREAAEAEEREFYGHRASDEWLDALKPFGTDANKPFLETAPWLIAVFLKKFSEDEHGEKVKHYYPTESTGLATGLLITALHEAGLATLTHTPSPMRFLNDILERPKTERPFLLLVVGYPADDCEVPDIRRKTLDEVASFIDD